MRVETGIGGGRAARLWEALVSTSDSPTFLARLRRFSPHRLLLAAAGVLCVGLAALGVFVPGLPTTVFLIAATYLFARSCPWLEERLIRNRLFAPFLRYIDGDTPMPLRAKLATMCIMWAFVAASVFLLGRSIAAPSWVIFMPPLAAVVGTWVIVRLGPAEAASRSKSVLRSES
jgi:hypothetical protein